MDEDEQPAPPMANRQPPSPEAAGGRAGGAPSTTGRPNRPAADGSSEPIGNRERALSAFVNRVAADGYRETHVEDVCRDVGASTRDFYAWFGKKDRCYLTVFAAFGTHVITVGERAYRDAAGPWETRLRVGLEAAFGQLTSRPKMVRFLSQSPHVDGSREALLSLMARSQHVYLTDEIRGHVDDIPPEPLEVILSSSVMYPIITYMREGKAQDIGELIPSMVYYLTLVFFGAERAARQLA